MLSLFSFLSAVTENICFISSFRDFVFLSAVFPTLPFYFVVLVVLGLSCPFFYPFPSSALPSMFLYHHVS